MSDLLDDHEAIVDAVRKMLGEHGMPEGFMATTTWLADEFNDSFLDAALRCPQRVILCYPKLTVKEFNAKVKERSDALGVKVRRLSASPLFADNEGVIAWLET